MSKMSIGRRIKRMFSKKEIRTQLTDSELLEIRELNRFVGLEHYRANQVKGNTALIPDGQKYASQLEAVARLMENSKNSWISSKLQECGYEVGTATSINLADGKISIT